MIFRRLADAFRRQGWATVLIDCPAPIEDSRVRELVEKISGDERLMEELRQWVSSMHIVRSIAENLIAYAGKLRESVNRCLDERKHGGAR